MASSAVALSGAATSAVESGPTSACAVDVQLLSRVAGVVCNEEVPSSATTEAPQPMISDVQTVTWHTQTLPQRMENRCNFHADLSFN